VSVPPARHRRALARPAAVAACVLAVGALPGCAGTEPAPAAGSSSSATGPSSTQQSTTAAPAGQRIEVAVAGGQVTGDTGRVPVASGTAVTLVVTSDAPDQVHVHGYDLETELAPGTPAELSFDATVPGVFEVELHEAGTVLLTLQVQ
jgi:hypothetical protein